MPYWKNTTSTTTLCLDRLDGRGTTLEVNPNETFFGSTTYAEYDSTSADAQQRWLTRQTTLVTVAGVHEGSNKWMFQLDPFQVDNLVASAADHTAYSHVVAAATYTAWGILTWTDGGGTSTQTFLITGDGVNTNAGTPNSVITVGSKTPGATASLQAVNNASGYHTISSASGRIVFGFDGAITSASIQVNYNPRDIGLNAGNSAQNPAKGARNTTVRTIVVAADNTKFPTWYVANSVGQVKTEKIFQSGSRVGDQALLRTYRYEVDNKGGQYNGTTNVPVATRIIETDDVVTAADLSL